MSKYTIKKENYRATQKNTQTIEYVIFSSLTVNM